MVIIDCEVYADYFLLAALDIQTGRVDFWEQYPGHALDAKSVRGLMSNNTTISFNGLSFDLPIIAAAVSGADCQTIKTIADKIIASNAPAWQIVRDYKITVPKSWDHIDLIEVAPGSASLKIYGGRLHSRKIQDLPISFDASIRPDQYSLLCEYCENDLRTTLDLYRALEPQVNLRIGMSKQYGIDLRSKSDAQIAEAIIKSEVSKITGKQYVKPDIEKNSFRYRDPRIVDFESSELRSVFRELLDCPFELSGNGSIKMPDWLADRAVHIAGKPYRIGIGGMHSCETRRAVYRKPGEILQDWDVASYYPSIILQQRLAPEAMGADFLTVYQSILRRRLEAKASGDKVTADALKIAVNGSFGKLGSKWSALYAPQLFLQVTVTGQLCLLMLIEQMESRGVQVISANTDGIVIHTQEHNADVVDEITFDWMMRTSFTLESSDYRALISRDVNTYLAIKDDGTYKGKGAFGATGLMKNPDMQIVQRSVAEYAAHGTPIEKTIRASRDVREFVSVRRVQGGARWRDELLGKAVRFYYCTSVGHNECIHYAKNSNRVPKSAGARPLMELPDHFPEDIYYPAYIEAADKMLAEVGL